MSEQTEVETTNKKEPDDIFTETLPAAQAALLPFAELLFFAYRDFTSDPDSILKEFGFGRAHHRVLHFVSRNPGLKVSELLKILKVTKQSLARILKTLVTEGYIEQRTRTEDKRARFLYPTKAGLDLMTKLITPQLDRLNDAFKNCDSEAKSILQDFLLHMISKEERKQVSCRIFSTPLLDRSSPEHPPLDQGDTTS